MGNDVDDRFLLEIEMVNGHTGLVHFSEDAHGFFVYDEDNQKAGVEITINKDAFIIAEQHRAKGVKQPYRIICIDILSKYLTTLKPNGVDDLRVLLYSVLNALMFPSDQTTEYFDLVASFIREPSNVH